MEATWRDLVRSFDAANLELVPDTASYLGALALRPQSLALGYDIFTRVGTTGDFLERARSAFTPTGTLNAVLLIGEGSAIISGGESLDEVQPGTAALIGDELVRIDTINASTGAITFGRGCVDTVPVEHAAGTRVWFLEDSTGDDPTEYTIGNTVQVRLLTVTGQGRLDIGSAVTDSIVMAQRQHRPYPPGNLQINGSAYPDTVTGDLSVTWSHRDRIVQADQLVDTTEGNIGPEPGVTYTLRIYNAATLERTVTGITGTGYTYANADELADGGPFNPIRFTLHAVRDGLESRQGHDCQVARS